MAHAAHGARLEGHGGRGVSDSRGSWVVSSLRSRSGLLQWVSIIASLAFVGWLLASRGDELRQLLSLTPLLFTLISVSALLTFVVNGIELKVLAEQFGNKIPVKDAFLLGLMVSTLNYLPLKMGTVLNGVILNVRYRLKWSHFAALVAGSSVIHLWVALTLAGIALIFTAPGPMGWALAGIPTLVVAALVVWGRSRREGRLESHSSKFVRAAGRAVDGLGLIFSNPRLLAIETVLNLMLIGLASLRMMWSFMALSTQVTFLQALVVTSVSIFAARLSVIPGGIGFKEGGAAAGSAMAGLDAGLGLAASVMDRAVTLVWLILLGVPAAIYLQHKTGIDLDDARRLKSDGDTGEEG